MTMMDVFDTTSSCGSDVEEKLGGNVERREKSVRFSKVVSVFVVDDLTGPSEVMMSDIQRNTSKGGFRTGDDFPEGGQGELC